MTSSEIAAMQKRVGTVPDRFWGPKSIAACQKFLRDLMPSPNPWPEPDQASLRKFYGEPGDERNLVRIEFPYELKYDGKIVTHSRVHEKCADSLLRVLANIRDRMEAVPDIIDDATDYYGIYNYRPKRGGSTWSLHAWGAAIDLDADDNTFRRAWPVSADMPLDIIIEFAREGWLSAAAFWGYDSMHFQCTR